MWVMIKPLKKQKIQVTTSQIPTIDLLNYDTEEDVLTPVIVVE